MPVQSHIVDEHQGRTNALRHLAFDMGQFIVVARGAAMLNTCLQTTQQLDIAWSISFLRKSGGHIDDLIVYRSATKILLSNGCTEEMPAAKSCSTVDGCVNREEIRLTDRSAKFGGVAIQGPALQSYSCSVWQTMPIPSRNSIADLPLTGRLFPSAHGYTRDGIELSFADDE